MVVVSNSSPIIHLAKIEQLHLLEQLYCQIIVPKKVFQECTVSDIYREEVKTIMKAKNKGMIESFKDSIQKLQTSGFRMSQDLLNALISQYG